MTSFRWQRVIAVLCAASLVLTSCYSLSPVPIPSGESPPALPAVSVGDTVIITTRTNETKTFVVTAVEADALVGKRVRVVYTDMATLNVKHLRKGPTTWVVLGVVFGILSIMAAVEAAEAYDDVFEGNY
ncbi:MAG TPA: hypothetical protein VEW08_03305 [Steroidobacteraceae bacterium]|nr:hypothetical protein [Steroidobacteraceae bacterium]